MSSTPLHRIDTDHDLSNVVPLARAPVPEGPYQIDTSAINRRTLQRRWIVISMLCHLLVIGALLFGLVEAPQPVPPPVLKITLVPRGPGGEGAAGGDGGSGAKEATAPAASSAQDKPDIPPPAPEQVAPQTPPQPEIPKPTPPSPEIPPPAPEPTRQPPPQTPPTPQPPQPMATMPPPAALEPPPPPKPHRIPPRLQAVRHREPPGQITVATPAPNPMPVPSPAPAATPAPTQTATGLATPGTGGGPGAKAGSGKGAEGIGKGAIGNGIGPGDDYLERLYRHLLQYKKYPPEAIGAKQQGSVIVGFTIARDGTVSNARIEKSSGSPSLDQATLALVRQASPAPPLPDSFKGGEARVKFPIDYKLSLIDQMF